VDIVNFMSCLTTCKIFLKLIPMQSFFMFFSIFVSHTWVTPCYWHEMLADRIPESSTPQINYYGNSELKSLCAPICSDLKCWTSLSCIRNSSNFASDSSNDLGAAYYARSCLSGCAANCMVDCCLLLFFWLGACRSSDVQVWLALFFFPKHHSVAR
jgi:hypothetical protein